LPNAFVKRALDNEVGPQVADAFKIERGPFPENSGSIKFDLSVSVRHASCLRSRRSYCQAARLGTAPPSGWGQDRLIFAGLYRLAPKVLGALAIVKPKTVIKWHRAGFRSYRRWKSRRPTVAPEIQKLIREMSIVNPLWGAPRIHGELLKLGLDIGQTSVAKYMVRRRDPPSQGWRTFLRNLADGIAAMDMFVGFNLRQAQSVWDWQGSCDCLMSPTCGLCCVPKQNNLGAQDGQAASFWEFSRDGVKAGRGDWRHVE
jgi:hypothetical protein